MAAAGERPTPGITTEGEADITPPVAPRPSPRAQRMIVVVWDGMRPDFVGPGLTPRLAALAAGGAVYRRATGVFPSVTRPTTASVSTGACPGAHGIIANLFAGPPGDRAPLDTGDRVALDRLRPGNRGRVLPLQTLAEALAAAGKRIVVLGSGSTGQVALLDPERAGTTVHLTFTWPEPLLATLVERFGPAPPKKVPVQAANDWLTGVLTDYVLPVIEPDVAIIWLCEPDASQHAHGLGAPETIAAMRGNDARLGRVLDAVKTSGVPTGVIVASDHGHSTVTGMVRAGEELATAGFGTAIADGRLLTSELAILVEEGPDARALRDAVGAWLAEQPWVGACIAWPHGDDRAVRLPDGAIDARALWNGRDRPPLAHAPAFTYSYRWSEEPNAHGVPGSALANFTAGLADFTRLQGPVVGLDRLTSTHGTLGPRDQRTVLVLAGAGIRPGAPDLPAGVVDLAPTVLALLGLPPLPDADGRPLAESFADGPKPATVAVRTEQVALLPGGVLHRHQVGGTVYLDTHA